MAVSTAFAQRTIKGRVVSDGDSEPLMGAAIVEKGTSNGVVADINGNFSISVQNNATLVVSYVGYTTQQVKPTSSNITIKLVEDSKLLNEVVTVGYGTMKKSDITGSVVSVNMEQMERKVPTDIAQALKGAAAGVMVIAQDGAPDANSAIRIRGIGTINGDAAPLYVVDGVKVGRDANFVNPSDIESIEVLKDASATAIYGSEGANGVIMITTKKGTKGKSNINVTADFGIQTLPYKIKTLGIDDHAKIIRDSRAADGTGLYNPVWDEKYDGQRNYIDWQDQMTQNALRQKYGISASGGNDKSVYNASVGYLNYNGLIVNTNFQRLTARVSASTKVNNYLEFGADINYSHMESNSDRGGINNNGNLSSHRDLAFMTPTLDYVENGKLVNVNVVNPDGSYGAMGASETPQGWEGNTLIMQNVYASKMQASAKNKRDRTALNGFANLTFIKNDHHQLDLHTIASLTASFGNSDNFTGGYTRKNLIGGEWVEFAANGNQLYQFSVNNNSSISKSIETYATYKWTTDFNNLTFMIGNSVSQSSGSWTSASSQDFLSPNIRDTRLSLDDSSKKGQGALNAETKMISYYGRLVYNLMDRYILTGTLRRDGSSNFSAGHKWGTFPSAAFAWRIKEESFLKDVDAISNLKLRLGWGQTGNAGNMGGMSIASLSTTAYYMYPAGTPSGLGSNHSNKQPGLYGALIDENLKWETNEQTNIGIDLGILGGDLNISADYFIRNTKDLLLWRQMRSSSGFTQIYTNFGSIRNQGLEFSINYNKRVNKDFSFNVTLNGSTLKNEVTKMDRPLYAQATGGNDGSTLDGSNVQAIDGGSRWDNHSISMEGYAIGSYYGWRVDKIYTSQAEVDADNAYVKEKSKGKIEYRQEPGTTVGDYRFKDLNGDGIIDNEDREVIGNGIPKFNFGLNLGATYKDWDFSIYTYGVLGQDILSYSAMRLSTTYVSDDNTFANILVDSYKDIQAGKLPRLTALDPNKNVRVSDAWIKNGNFLRLSTVQVGYTFPKAWVAPLGVQKARAYVSVQNLALFSSYAKYGDPEVGQGSVLYSGLDTGRYPTPRTFQFGLNVTF